MPSPADMFHRAYCFLARPSLENFFIYLGLLWILNAADVWQTMALKYSGSLASEANQLVDYVLIKGPIYFISFKVLAIILVSSVLIRGYFHNQGIKLGETQFSPDQVRAAIIFLLICSIVYYLVVVFFPLIVILLTFSPPGEAAYV